MKPYVSFGSDEHRLLEAIAGSPVRTLKGSVVVRISEDVAVAARRLFELGLIQAAEHGGGAEWAALTEAGRNEIARLDALFERRILVGSLDTNGDFVLPADFDEFSTT